MIGIVINTRNRPNVLSVSLFNYCRYWKGNQRIVVIDDNSTNAGVNRNIVEAARSKYGVPISYHYNEQRLGVANSKNEGLKRVKDCDYIFLCDDDVFPISGNYWKTFIRAAENTGNHHFQYIRHGGLNNNYKRESTKHNIESYNTGSGWFLFLTKKAFDIVGGFNPEYDLYGYEHVGYSYRINNMGLTPLGIFLCPMDAKKYIHSLDMDGIPNQYKTILKDFKSTESVSFREQQMKSTKGKMAFEKDLKEKYYQQI